MPAKTRTSRKRFENYRTLRRGPTLWDSDQTPHDVPRPGTRSKSRGRSFLTLFAEFLRLIRSHRRIIAFSLLTATVSTLLGLLPLYGTKLVFDNVLGDRPLPEAIGRWLSLPDDPRALLVLIAVTMVGLAVLSLAIGMVGRWHLTRTNKHVQSEVRRLVFDHAIRLPLHRSQRMKSGGVASVISEDTTAVSELLFGLLYNPWRAVIQLSGCLAILTWTDWRLLLGSLVILPVVWITHKTWIARIRPMYKDIRATRQHTNAHATEVFAGIRVVRGFNRQRTEVSRFTANTHLMARQELMAWWWARGIDITWSILIPVATATVLTYGSIRILNDTEAVRTGLLAPAAALTTGDLVMFLTYLGWLLGPIATLAASAAQFQNGLAGLDRILDLLEEPREFPDNPAAKSINSTDVQGRITLDDVWFTYPGGDHPVIHGVSLDVQPGQTVALVGRSGSGKTTLCNLIARFHDPDRGAIRLDGQDLRDISVDSYRSLLGIVEQDVFLFDGTIAENIAYGLRGADRGQIVRAALRANAHEFITGLDHGYDTMIGERGVRLSGGQRQRLAIARAALASPRVFILDEATSSLDTESERLIQASLRSFMADRTSFVIAHRLSTIHSADLILVIDQGRIVERGTHDQLMEQSGAYRKMVRLQTYRPDSAEDDLDPQEVLAETS